MKTIVRLAIALLMAPLPIRAKIDLVTVPTRDTVQVSIYNSADLTLVRENRALTVKEGLNRLQFSWANTLIDPTSLEMRPLAHAAEVNIMDLIYPPRVKNLGLWNIESGVSGRLPVEITYLTSGLSWRAFYMGTLAEDEKSMRLQGYVRVTNNSGEDYENASTRLVVGKVHILDQIADLARRKHPYGNPAPEVVSGRDKSSQDSFHRFYSWGFGSGGVGGGGAFLEKKKIHKEGLSEYFLYTIEGQETIPHGWSKRLPSFEVGDVPVVNLYKFEEERYGRQVVRFLSFKNDEDHKLGETPIPGGLMKVYRLAGEPAGLSYEGQSNFKYIPVDEDVELNLGGVGNVSVEPTLMDFRSENYVFHNNGNIRGWDEMRRFKVEVKNTRDVAVEVEIQRNFKTNSWKLEKEGAFGEYEKVDLDTVKFTLELEPRSNKTFTYDLTTYHGSREDQR
ncbi:MAG: DUF4139 domain-containing protein [Verrucomicrobiota bacterium]